MKKRVLLKAPILTQSGYGEHSRYIFRILLENEQGIELFVEPLNWGQTGWLCQDTAERRKIDHYIGKFNAFVQQCTQAPFDICIHIDIPIAWQRVAPYMIGVTAGLEADAVSPHWLGPTTENVDKVFVTSNFSKKGFLNSIDKYSKVFDPNTLSNLDSLKQQMEEKIFVLNYPVKEYELEDLHLDFKTDYNFLLVAQWSARKNIEQTVECFLEEFKNDESVGLIIKTNLARNCVADRLLCEEKIRYFKNEKPDSKCKIYFMHGTMTENEMHSLYHHPKIKAMINFGHGEGYGLPLFEAAYCGLPVITHDFGGQTDFLYAPKKNKNGKTTMRPHFSKVAYDVRPVDSSAVWNKIIEPDSEWAYPNFSACKIAMRESIKNYGVLKGEAKRLKKWILKEFTKEKQYERFVNLAFDGVDFEEAFKMEEWLQQLENEIQVHS